MFLGDLYVRKIPLYFCDVLHWISLAYGGILKIDFRAPAFWGLDPMQVLLYIESIEHTKQIGVVG